MSWQQVLRTNFTRWGDLMNYLELDLPYPHPNFVLNLPRRLAAKIPKGSPDDPLLRQFLPSPQEHEKLPMFTTNPVGDDEVRKSPRLLHKYRGRCLLVTTSACAMHCRYCFRQHFDYEAPPTFQAELEVIRNDPSIHEVILSGGDPLSLSNRRLADLIDQLAAIPHLRILRFHTRFPIGIPERIEAEFLKILASTRLQVTFIVHVNHAGELDADVTTALKQVQQLGIPLLNQAVLLRGVNDTTEALYDLSLSLISHGIIPYYLHQLDRVQGAAHFEVAEREGLALIESLRPLLPGYAIPAYVRETAGQPSKSPVDNLNSRK